MTAQTLPPKIEAALALLETSTDLAAGEDAFWTVQRFQNGFGLKLAVPNILLSILFVVLGLAWSERGWTDPTMLVLIIAAALLTVAFFYATRKGAKAAHAANARMSAALRRWRALASTSLSEKGVA
ncbi:MAG: hypothetical protein ACOYKM_04580 [Caulobacterales bacterium]